LHAGQRIFHYVASGSRGLSPWSGELKPGEGVVERARVLWSALIPDLPMIYGLGAVAGSDGFATRDQRLFFAMLADLPRDRAVHLLQALGVNALLGADVLPLPAGTKFAPSSPPWLYRLPNSAPRAYFAERILEEADVPSALERASDLDFRPGRDAVVLGSSGAVPRELSSGESQILGSRPGVLRAELRAAGPGLWVVSDTWFPGWRATIDDAPAD